VCRKSAFNLLFTCLPYRGEWRYRQMAHRVMLIDVGHVGQNAMLSASALGLGSCCLAAFDSAKCDDALGVNGVDEYTIYAVTAGNINE
jgi:SagB-type dehydrogenase family enzyme